MIRRPPRSTLDRSSAASDVYKRQVIVLAAVIGIGRYALVMAGRMPGSKLDRGLMSGFTGLMDLNVLLGLIYLLLSLIHISEPTRPY